MKNATARLAAQPSPAARVDAISPRASECWFRRNNPNATASSSWGTATVVVPAVFREWRPTGPPQWLVDLYDVYWYQRVQPASSCYLPNVAFESGVFLHFIVEHWAALPAYAAFVQADWFATRGIGGYVPINFWQPACARQHGAGWMPLGKRNNRWPPYTIERVSKFWELEPSARPLAHGAAHIASLVERCTTDLLDDFEIARPQVPRLRITFHPYMNFVASRARLQTRPLHTWRVVRDRLMRAACLHEPNSSASSMPDNPRFSKVHASVMEMLQVRRCELFVQRVFRCADASCLCSVCFGW